MEFGLNRPVKSAAVSHDGKLQASGSREPQDNQVEAWWHWLARSLWKDFLAPGEYASEKWSFVGDVTG